MVQDGLKTMKQQQRIFRRLRNKVTKRLKRCYQKYVSKQMPNRRWQTGGHWSLGVTNISRQWSITTVVKDDLRTIKQQLFFVRRLRKKAFGQQNTCLVTCICTVMVLNSLRPKASNGLRRLHSKDSSPLRCR